MKKYYLSIAIDGRLVRVAELREIMPSALKLLSDVKSGWLGAVEEEEDGRGNGTRRK
jgi:hypothetical protein